MRRSVVTFTFLRLFFTPRQSLRRSGTRRHPRPRLRTISHRHHSRLNTNTADCLPPPHYAPLATTSSEPVVAPSDRNSVPRGRRYSPAPPIFSQCIYQHPNLHRHQNFPISRRLALSRPVYSAVFLLLHLCFTIFFPLHFTLLTITLSFFPFLVHFLPHAFHFHFCSSHHLSNSWLSVVALQKERLSLAVDCICISH